MDYELTKREFQKIMEDVYSEQAIEMLYEYYDGADMTLSTREICETWYEYDELLTFMFDNGCPVTNEKNERYNLRGKSDDEILEEVMKYTDSTRQYMINIEHEVVLETK